MIREIINFTNDIIEDCPDIMQRNLKPNGGLYIFVDIDEAGNWVNENGVYGQDYLYLKTNDSESSIPISEITALEEEVKRVGTSMNKVLDKSSQIFSCSPYAVVFKKKSLTNEKIPGIKGEKICKLLPFYFENARKLCPLEEQQRIVSFESICSIILKGLENFIREQADEKKIVLIDQLKDDEYISIYLRSVSLNDYKKAHDCYLKDKLYNKGEFNKTVNGILYGVSGFLNGLNDKKLFLVHRTACMDEGLCGRISFEEALLLDKFQSLILRKVLPNPLSIAVNQLENKLFLKLFHENETPLSYRELIKSLFEQHEIKELSDFYLLNYSKAKDIVINDIDFVPMFRYYFDKPLLIENVMLAGYKRDEIFEEERDISLKDIFSFEYVVVREIFNNCLVMIKKDGSYKSLYFGEVDLSKRSDNGKFLIYQLIMKYRYAFYEYIYKSKQNAINVLMFDEMMFTSILASIKNEEVKSRFSFNNVIKRKLNIWFSLYNLFNNNDKKKEVMASNVTDLMSKMRLVAKGEAVLETPEEFAFAAGQLVSYLMDQSVASDKTYSMLEPYLQKTKSKHLQDAIAHVFSQYKHAVSIYGKAFKALASNVLTYDEDVDMKPLLKYFLAGCFSNCVIYEKKEEN
ncbi:hypothetical protein [Phocaeicola salanitronis]|uniref:hypothetical protein n=1 Tax=Phocaeicola salanitronis TaxID=376805 RepID=UPI0025A45A6C|nr:hypothetical protein [Phocaeicola salanitronis]MDM8304753.1 hypothetical protein [Phocaeicola salanitronis]